MANNNSVLKNSASSGNSKNSGSTVGKFFFAIFAIIFTIGLMYVIYITILWINAKNKANPVVVNDVIDADVARPPLIYQK